MDGWEKLCKWTQLKYRDTIKHAGMRLRKEKAHLELKLVREIKGNLIGFCRLFSSKRKTRENMSPQLNGEGDLLTKDAEKDTVFCAFFILIFIGKVSLQ